MEDEDIAPSQVRETKIQIWSDMSKLRGLVRGKVGFKCRPEGANI